MKQKLLSLSFLVLWVSTSTAQDAYERYTNFFSVELNTTASFAGLGVVPSASLYRNGHKIDVGLFIKAYDIWQDGPGILGSYLSYKYYPNVREKEFNLYFGYHNLFSAHNRSKVTPVSVNELTDEILYPKETLLFENFVGIGFDFQMGNKFYFFNDYSVGVALDWNTFQDTDTQMEIRSTGMIRLGIGYNVAAIRAK